MTRTQLQLDDDTYEALRRRAHLERQSMSAVARKLLRESLGMGQNAQEIRGRTFSFVSSGASGRKDISVRHDEALAEDFQ
ncbi:MAG: FitA-like ribbon-helix-helix domain-containing protein [Armatimonadota bacterium]